MKRIKTVSLQKSKNIAMQSVRVNESEIKTKLRREQDKPWVSWKGALETDAETELRREQDKAIHSDHAYVYKHAYTPRIMHHSAFIV